MTRILDPLVAEALDKIEDFIAKATGQSPSAEELASALTRYFVLKEILEFVKMSREEADPGNLSQGGSP